MATGAEGRGSPAQGLLALALGTAVAVCVIWAAFVDISHGESDLTAEHTFLGICAVWLLYVGVRLIWTSYRVLGGLSLLALAAGVWEQLGIGPGAAAGLHPSYVATSGALLWFLALVGILAYLSWRASR